MKIFHVTGSLTRSAGGLFYSVSGLARAQFEAGADVAVIGPADDYFEEDKRIWGDVPLFPIKAPFRYATVPEAVRVILKQKPDVVNIHGIWGDPSVIGRILVAMGFRTCVSPHGMLDPWIMQRRPKLKAIHAWLFERPLVQRSLNHALNEAEREATLLFLKGKAAAIFVAPNGIEPPTLVASEKREGALYLGRLHEKKQVIELIQAWGRNNALRRVSLTVAGWGDAAYTQRVASACAEFDNVIFVGSVYGPEKEAAFANAKFFVLPSVSEGLPMAVLEAMSFGTIPFITAECNLPHLFDAEAAIKIKSDFSDFDTVVPEYVEMPESALDLFRQAMTLQLDQYSWHSIAVQFQSAYDRHWAGLDHSLVLEL